MSEDIPSEGSQKIIRLDSELGAPDECTHLEGDVDEIEYWRISTLRLEKHLSELSVEIDSSTQQDLFSMVPVGSRGLYDSGTVSAKANLEIGDHIIKIRKGSRIALYGSSKPIEPIAKQLCEAVENPALNEFSLIMVLVNKSEIPEWLKHIPAAVVEELPEVEGECADDSVISFGDAFADPDEYEIDEPEAVIWLTREALLHPNVIPLKQTKRSDIDDS